MRPERDIRLERADEMTEVGDMISVIDQLMEDGVSRLKVKVTEELEPGERRRQYHHGRCDINSPFANGTPFDVI